MLLISQYKSAEHPMLATSNTNQNKTTMLYLASVSAITRRAALSRVCKWLPTILVYGFVIKICKLLTCPTCDSIVLTALARHTLMEPVITLAFGRIIFAIAITLIVAITTSTKIKTKRIVRNYVCVPPSTTAFQEERKKWGQVLT